MAHWTEFTSSQGVGFKVRTWSAGPANLTLRRLDFSSRGTTLEGASCCAVKSPPKELALSVVVPCGRSRSLCPGLSGPDAAAAAAAVVVGGSPAKIEDHRGSCSGLGNSTCGG